MKNIKKFLIVGAVATGLMSSAFAATDPTESAVKDHIVQGIQHVVQSQFNKGFLTEKADITVNVVPKKKAKDSIDELLGVKSQFADLSENNFRMIANQCKVTLSFDDAGESPTLTKNEIIKSVTKFENENQREIMRQFIALHEHYHCEFSTIENPISIEGKSSSFNKKVNYFLKDINTIGIDGVMLQGYIDTLNENYADISAISSLIKEYGANNKDLQYVIKAVKIQRHETYLNNNVDSHFTHMGLDSIMSEKSIEKLVNTNDPKEFKNLMLDTANKSVQKLFAQRKDLAETLFSKKAISMSVFTNLIREINQSTLTDEELKNYNFTTLSKDYVSQGLSRKVAQELLEGEDLKGKGLRPTTMGDYANSLAVMEFTNNLLDNKKIGMFTSWDLEKYPKVAEEFKEAIYEQNNKSLLEFDDKTKGDIVNKIQELKSKFLEETKGNTIKLSK